MAERRATCDDLEGLMNVVLSAMPQDPAWDYRFPYRHNYPEDERKYQTLFFKFMIDPSYEDFEVRVLEAPRLDDPSTSMIVAFAVWDVTYINKRRHGPDYVTKHPGSAVNEAGGSSRRDANFAHMKAFREGGAAAKHTYFDGRFGYNQIHLQILGTHPDYQRRGYGSALCAWGMKRAQQDNVAISLLASPMGFKLYLALGFEDLGKVTVQVKGETEAIVLRPMSYVPEKGPERLELL
jgi:GNAT superfamily N-acetyltransferase